VSDTRLICPICERQLDDDQSICPIGHGITGGVHGVHAGVLSSTPRAKRHLLGVTVGDAYIINGYLGSGGFGAVYRAEQKALGRDVALKLLMLDAIGDETIVQRFKREARTAASILDPNVVTLFDYGEASIGQHETEQVLYIAMELVHGPTLRQLTKREGGLGLEGTLTIGMNILRGLAAAHQMGVVHRDLKPGNVLIDESKNRKLYARLFDFGIASLQGSGGHTTQIGQGGVLGTPKYMAPEQWRAQQTAPCTDIYAFGVIMAEIILGRPPVPKMELIEMAAAHCRSERPHITHSSKGEELPLALTHFIKKCMAIDPRQRYGSASEALVALQEIEQTRDAANVPVVTHFAEPGSLDPGDESRSASMSTGEIRRAPMPPPPPELRKPPEVSFADLSTPEVAQDAEVLEVRLEEPRRIWPWALAIVGIVLAVVGWRLGDALQGDPPPQNTPANTVSTQPAPEPVVDAAKPDAAVADAAVADAAAPDAAQPDAAQPDAAPEPDASTPTVEAKRPKRPKTPVVSSKAPKAVVASAPPVAPVTDAPRLVARRVGGYDVTPKANPTPADISKAHNEFIRAVDAEKRGAPKTAQRYLAKALRLGLKGSEAKEALRRLKKLADQASLEASEF
jgi:eukaryotic-like serine/threonine-protein kinase